MIWLPWADPSPTDARVISILMEQEQWSSTGPFTCGGIIFVPGNRSDIMRSQHISADDQKKEATKYYVKCSPYASWGNLAEGLYKAGEKRATEAFRTQLPEPIGNQCDWVNKCVCSLCNMYRYTVGGLL